MSLYDSDKFDVEDEHAGGCARLVFIGEFFGNPDESFLTWDHELNGFGPAGDDLVEPEFDRLVASNR